MLSRFSCLRLFAITWTVARQAPLSMGILWARIVQWVAMLFFRGSSRPGMERQAGFFLFCFVFLPLAPPGKPRDRERYC